MNPKSIRESVGKTYRALRSGTTSSPISEHVLGTYASLRLGLGLIGLVFPFALVGFGIAVGVPTQDSISSYYFASAPGECVFFPTRTPFVGALCALSVGLYLYKGFTALENWLLNAAAILGLCVAFIPEHVTQELADSCPILAPYRQLQLHELPLHFTSAVLMFVCLGAVAWFCASKTLQYLPPKDRHREKRFRIQYKTIALCMLAIGPLAILLNGAQWKYTVLLAEGSGILFFAWYWLLKSREMALSDGELKAIRRDQRPGSADDPTIGGARVAGPAHG